MIGKLAERTVRACNRTLQQLIEHPPLQVSTLTAGNGTEFHGYKALERRTGVAFYFAPAYHAWERGLNENTNGLIRQSLPQGASRVHLTQSMCEDIANRLNRRPRQCLNYQTPEQIYLNNL